MTRKKHTDHARNYRKNVTHSQAETSFQVVVEQTDLFIIAERDLSVEAAAIIHEVRSIIKAHMLINPLFGTSLAPVQVPEGADPVILAMAKAATLCGVGPMATVAGAVAQAVATRLAPLSENIIVENGGDIYMNSTTPRTVALLSDPDSGSQIALKIDTKEFPVAICSSSGNIGHSLSLGSGDLVTVRSKDARLADAAATALANHLQSPADVPLVIEKARTLSEQLTKSGTKYGLDGVFVQYDSKIGAWGEIELIAL
ncbi:MAG: thiamine biosynthesis protein ApbE [Desulfovibrio sp. S3730MH75]|nr:MAG: thiamine biosynthesis protein ApbE [Desulfovibrio sp. S3730MH75]